MKKNLLSSLNKNLIIMLSGMLFIFSTLLNLHAENNNNIIEHILQVKEANFDRALTTEEKMNIISNKFTFVFEQNNNNINALALAIAYGDIRRVEKFLDIVDNVNDERLWVSVSDSGEPEPYTIADVVINHENIIDTDDANLLNYYAIVQLLINKKIKFNISPKEAYEKLPTFNQTYISDKERIAEIVALFDIDHPYYMPPFLESNRFQTPKTKSFNIMMICGAKYGYDNLHPTIYNAFREGHTELKNTLLARLDAA